MSQLSTCVHHPDNYLINFSQYLKKNFNRQRNCGQETQKAKKVAGPAVTGVKVNNYQNNLITNSYMATSQMLPPVTSLISVESSSTLLISFIISNPLISLLIPFLPFRKPRPGFTLNCSRWRARAEQHSDLPQGACLPACLSLPSCSAARDMALIILPGAPDPTWHATLYCTSSWQHPTMHQCPHTVSNIQYSIMKFNQ